jgi:hypothetical protein
MKSLCLAIMFVTLPTLASADDANQLSKSEKGAGFELLFNGTDLKGWKHNNNWVAKDGVIARSKGGGSLTYQVKKIPDNFELRFDWKVGKGSNSGVYYRPGQYEYQILDNKVHGDGKNPRTSAASLYFCMAPSKDATKPVGEWNSGRIVCQGSVVQHWLNGVKVIDFDYTDSKWKFNVELLKQRGANLNARSGSLYFQDHGDPVWYRSIKLRELSGTEKLDATPVTPAKIPEDILKAERKKLDGIVKRRKK